MLRAAYHAQTLQIEGLADEPSGEALVRLKRRYLAASPDGIEREQWAGSAA